MFNLTHDETSAIDVGGVWTGPDEFELCFRLNQDLREDLEIHIVLTYDELKSLVDYLDTKLAFNKLRNM
jgi:hypothetical protein